MDDYVTKPVRDVELRAALARAAPVQVVAPAPEAEQSVRVSDVPHGFDAEVVRMLRAMKTAAQPDLFATLLGVYLPMLAELTGEMRTAVASGDPAMLQQAAHKLRGSSANIGASAVAVVCGKLERLGKAGNLEGAGSLMSELESLAAQLLDPGRSQR